jgi:hypothetical protein
MAKDEKTNEGQDQGAPAGEVKAATTTPPPAPVRADRIVQAIKALGLDRAKHVLAAREYPDRVVIVTNGGQKLTYPGDEARAASLTDAQKDGIPQDTPHKNTQAKAKATREAEAKAGK